MTTPEPFQNGQSDAQFTAAVAQAQAEMQATRQRHKRLQAVDPAEVTRQLALVTATRSALPGGPGALQLEELMLTRSAHFRRTTGHATEVLLSAPLRLHAPDGPQLCLLGSGRRGAQLLRDENSSRQHRLHAAKDLITDEARLPVLADLQALGFTPDTHLSTRALLDLRSNAGPPEVPALWGGGMLAVLVYMFAVASSGVLASLNPAVDRWMQQPQAPSVQLAVLCGLLLLSVPAMYHVKAAALRREVRAALAE